MLILAQAPQASRVAGYRRWQSLGRQVRKGERGIAILAPCVQRGRPVDDWEEADRPEVVRILRGFRVTHVWDVSQTDGDPLPDVAPVLLDGEAPAGLWDSLAAQVAEAGYRLDRGECGGANGRTNYLTRTVRVRDDVDDAQAAKTLAHDPLTAPARRPCTRRTKDLAHPRLWALTVVDCVPTNRGGRIMEGRDVTALVAVRTGRLETTASVTGVRLLDGDGLEVAAVSEFLRSLLASGASLSSLRSYAMDLLRWWRFLDAVGLAWERAGRVETRDFVLWMRSKSKRPPDGGQAHSPFAPATINHNLAVLRRFYSDRMAAGTGPLINPVPDVVGRNRERPHAHHNPMQAFERHRRAPLRQRTPSRQPKSLPDHCFDELFAAMSCDRDRALLAFFVSTGTRAAELLGVTVEHVDVGGQLIGVHRKGSGRLQWLPASPDAFVWLRLYQAHQSRPDGETALWLTRRAPHRPLTYPALRRVLQRANDHLGQSWTLHQLRHTAAQRMMDDPRLSLTDVQWLLGHAHLETTEVYLRPREDEVVARVRQHHQRRDQPPPAAPDGAYRPEVLRSLLGGAAGVH